ncbi:MAG: restriction endonuclease subunit S, partial [Dolichospermum sp.]
MSVPKLRFKEFSGKWQRKKLGEIFEIRSGTTPFRGTEAFFKNGHHYWIKTTDLNN